MRNVSENSYSVHDGFSVSYSYKLWKDKNSIPSLYKSSHLVPFCMSFNTVFTNHINGKVSHLIRPIQYPNTIPKINSGHLIVRLLSELENINVFALTGGEGGGFFFQRLLLILQFGLIHIEGFAY